jgi:structural maintenance of chromosome 1
MINIFLTPFNWRLWHQKPDLVALEAQIAHGPLKVNNALEAKEESAKTEENLAQKVENYENELVSVKRPADKAQGMIISCWSTFVSYSRPVVVEEQRRASQQNVALTEESLEEYRQL